MRRMPVLLIILILGYVFLYGPILSLIVYSFNASKLVTVWSGFSTKWYAALLQNDALLEAAGLSVKIAAVVASLSVLLGTLAAIVLVRYKKSRGTRNLAMLVTAPMVMPEVIIGLSLLLLFIAMEDLIGWPKGRGQLTIILAHTTFAMAYVTLIVQSRLAHMDPSLEEVAEDLGARPATVFFAITLPLIAPALLAGWLLAFTLSLDDLVVANFVSGPGATTLPMVVYSSVRLGVSPEINALATLIVVFVSVAVCVSGFVLHRQEKRREAEQ
ncbi:ABC transporter permease subunit [Saccharophagus degradans]|uniref:Binding-protein-dependent transport systems inner membrane component n=1 Tax=Saccharophagus degradans (strain 2-40 / ATCC 43961 / DSM 17024) TaxID=203122 RepID=Q21L03_SACD2|nr:ABC transporter permease subunit [Saccharophagus degradans]ABD80626.1 binding-protein-dependent transport systems inner membrane component [Saccharophagus degradans 2-40]